ncbi:MAG TPA: ATP-binding protein, partial [Anaerolineales bacterium]|nr:ATP-binding protein [Anaerolineales bacterium]
RGEVRPRELAEIAANEVDALTSYLRDPSFPTLEHGGKFCTKGLSEQTLLGLAGTTRQFFLTHSAASDMPQVLDVLGRYQSGVVQGFIKAREQIILAEQERIRGALQIALSRYTVEIKEVQEMAKKATEANEFKTQFIARMSHELRTPLGALLGLAEMLQQNVYGTLSAPQNDIVQRIISNAEGLKQVFSELLDQSQMESGNLRLKEKPFTPETLVRRVHGNYLAMALEKGLSMHVEVNPGLPKTLIGDETRIEQILSNLVVNAIKFTKKGGIKIRTFQNNDAQWAMQVKDTGIGIDAENQQQIFEPFRQADEHTSRRYGGVGLGLAIVQQLVAAMQGSIHLESKPGQGSTFTVYLPIRERETQ